MTNFFNKTTSTTKKWLLGLCTGLAVAGSVMVSIPSTPSAKAATTTQVVNTEPTPQEVASSIRITPHDERQIQCLAQNAYFEAGNQSDRGMIAVTNVVMNRVEDGRFPRTPCAVINQRTRNVCQFSWVCEGKKNVRNMEIFRRAREAAERVYLQETPDVTHGALFYHANYVNPRWNLRRVTTIGAHIFYRG